MSSRECLCIKAEACIADAEKEKPSIADVGGETVRETRFLWGVSSNRKCASVVVGCVSKILALMNLWKWKRREICFGESKLWKQKTVHAGRETEAGLPTGSYEACGREGKNWVTVTVENGMAIGLGTKKKRGRRQQIRHGCWGMIQEENGEAITFVRVRERERERERETSARPSRYLFFNSQNART
ncbi:hypothetical protein ACLOJK_031239 [Asimina triloba]